MNTDPRNSTAGFTSPSVQRLRRLIGRRSSRSDERCFVVEGPVLVAEAIAAGWTFDTLYVAADFDGGRSGFDVGELVRGPLAGVDIIELAAGTAGRVADTQTPTGLFAIVGRRDDQAALATATRVVVADRLADPGNLGTIMRSAEAAGFDAVVVTPGTVDATSPKVVRASAGAVFHVPVIEAGLDEVAAAGLRLIGTSSHRGQNYVDADWTGRLALVAGNEAHGLDDDAPVDTWVRIDHAGRAESLNVAMATTLLCFAAAERA